MANPDVFVAGAGPVGLFSALSLLERGVSVDIVDALGPHLVRGYACGLQPGVLPRFDRLGLLRPLLAQAHRIDRLALRGRSGATCWVSFDRLRGDYPFMLTLRQSALEELLENALAQRGVRVARHQTLQGISPRDGRVQVTIASTHPARSEPRLGPPQRTTRESAFVIGADGSFSACRKALGIDLVELRPPRVFAFYDFHADLSRCQREASISLDGGAAAFWPLDERSGRWTFELNEGFADEPSLGQLRQLLRERAPWFVPVPEQLCWGAVAEFESRVARRFGNGRTWLAGDAAHCATPIGFQSMNQGFCEADDLAGLIAATLRGERLVGAFAEFERAHQALWRRLMGVGQVAAAAREGRADPRAMPGPSVFAHALNPGSTSPGAGTHPARQPATPHSAVRRPRAGTTGRALAT